MRQLSFFKRLVAPLRCRARRKRTRPWRSLARLGALALALSCGSTAAWPQEIEWLHQFGTEGYDDGTGIAAHTSGVYVIGRVQGALPGQTAAGNIDAFVRKYDFSGVEIWTRQFSLNDNTEPFGIDVDDTGIYVVGRALCSRLGAECGAFARKYSHNGTVIWTHRFQLDDPATSVIDAWGVAADATGVYVTGAGVLEGLNTALLSRLDQTGNEVWTALAGVPYQHPNGFLASAIASGVAVDATGVYVAGALGTADVRRFDFHGSLVDEYGTGTIAGWLAEGLAIDDSGVYVSGVLCPPDCQFAAVVRKYDRDGNELWTREVPDASNGADIAIDEHGVYLTGLLEREFFVFSAFVLRLDNDGELAWVRELDTDGFERGEGLAAHAGNLYVTGFTSGVFPGQAATPQQDVFVAKLNQRGPPHVLSDILPNAINPMSRGVIPVVIFTTPDFDATDVDPLSVRFGPAAAIETHGRGHYEDVDDDGDTDLVLHFSTRASGIVCGDTEADLSGETFAGEPIEGSDTFVTVGCS